MVWLGHQGRRRSVKVSGQVVLVLLRSREEARTYSCLLRYAKPPQLLRHYPGTHSSVPACRAFWQQRGGLWQLALCLLPPGRKPSGRVLCFLGSETHPGNTEALCAPRVWEAPKETGRNSQVTVSSMSPHSPCYPTAQKSQMIKETKKLLLLTYGHIDVTKHQTVNLTGMKWESQYLSDNSFSQFDTLHLLSALF